MLPQHRGEVDPPAWPLPWKESGAIIRYFSYTILWHFWEYWDTLRFLQYGGRQCFQTKRLHSLLPVRSLYGSWTHHLPDDPPHACRTSDAAGVAAGHHDLGGACPTGPAYSNSRGSDVDHRPCRHRWERPPLRPAVRSANCGDG